MEQKRNFAKLEALCMVRIGACLTFFWEGAHCKLFPRNNCYMLLDTSRGAI
jgi:hypothetical protein